MAARWEPGRCLAFAGQRPRPALEARLEGAPRIYGNRYDWSLNDAGPHVTNVDGYPPGKAAITCPVAR